MESKREASKVSVFVSGAAGGSYSGGYLGLGFYHLTNQNESSGTKSKRTRR